MGIIETYIDKSLDIVDEYREYLMYVGEIDKTLYDIEIHPDMIQLFDMADYKSCPQTAVFEQTNSDGYMVNIIDADSNMWKAIDSDITDWDIEQLEKQYSFELPDDYKQYLKYKYFYQIFCFLNIKLYPKPKGAWMDILKLKNEQAREYDLATEDHFVIGEYIDYAYIAINTKNNKIEMLDWGIFDTIPLADSFTDMLSIALNNEGAIIKKK